MKTLVAALSAALLSTMAADAATFKPIYKGVSLVMTGDIVPGDEERLVDAYNASCDQRGYCPERIFLNSLGDVAVSLYVADRIIESGMDTVVGETDMCMSACFNIFAAGDVRAFFATSVIGVHAYHDINGNWTPEGTAITATALSSYVAVPDSILLKMLTTPPTEMTYLKYDDLIGWAQFLENKR